MMRIMACAVAMLLLICCASCNNRPNDTDADSIDTQASVSEQDTTAPTDGDGISSSESDLSAPSQSEQSDLPDGSQGDSASTAQGKQEQSPAVPSKQPSQSRQPSQSKPSTPSKPSQSAAANSTPTPSKPASSKPSESKPAASKPAQPAQSNDSYVNEILRLVNEHRAEHGLSALTLDSDLNKVAKIRAQEITEKFDHARPNGTFFYDMMDEMGIDYRSVGENIAAGYLTAEEVVDAWMNSEGHRANILSANFKQIGIAATYKEDSEYEIYWVQIFGNLT